MDQLLNPPYLLMLIRDRRVATIGELYRMFGAEAPDYRVATSSKQKTIDKIDHILMRFYRAGLIEIDGDSLIPTDRILEVQRALDLSLSTLANARPHSVVVEPIFRSTAAPDDIPEVFVLMPFEKTLESVYKYFRKVCDRLDLSIARADDFYHAHAVMDDVWSKIYGCKIVIADCTGRNPNVFYEIGIAHTVGKPVILVTQDLQDIPFDLRHLRHIAYQFTPDGMIDFEEALVKSLASEVRKLVLRDSRGSSGSLDQLANP
jgi:hypothetical protein